MGFLGGIVNILGSLFSGGIAMGFDILKQAFSSVVQYHQAGIEFARSMGMSLQQAQSYTQVLTERAETLANKYGLSAEAVKELQVNLSQASGKAMMLGDDLAEQFVRINKLVGSNVANQFTAEITTHLGGSLNAVTGAVSKAYATAAKSGLNAAQFSEKVARNLSLANKLSFRDGVNGIIRMTALSEKLGFNLQSVESAANNFMELDKAIEHSAQLQMLGGSAGAFGSNPLTMAYEANYDPEAFTERMTKTLGSYATFDAKTGMANVNGMNRDFVKAVSEAMGIPFEEAMSIAKKQAEVKYKESQFEPQLSGYSGEMRDYVLNASYVGSDGKLKMTDRFGKERDVNDLEKSGELAEMMAMANKSDEEIMRDQALTLTSINEQLEGLQTSAVAAMAKKFVDIIPKIQDMIREIAPSIIKTVGEFAGKLANNVNDVIDFVKDAASTFKDVVVPILKGIKDVLGFFFDNFKWFVAAYLGAKLYKGASNVRNLFKSGKAGTGASSAGGARASGNAAASGKSISFGKRIKNGLGITRFGDVKAGYQLYRESGSGRIASLVKGAKLAGPVSKFAKVGGAASAVLGGIQIYSSLSGYGDMKDDINARLASGEISKYQAEEELKNARTQRNEGVGGAIGGTIGAIAGSFLGPLGTIAGGFIGNFIGEKLGSVAEPIYNFGKKLLGFTGIFGDAEESIEYYINKQKSINQKIDEIEAERNAALERMTEAEADGVVTIFEKAQMKLDEAAIKVSEETLESLNKTKEALYAMASDKNTSGALREQVMNSLHGERNWMSPIVEKVATTFYGENNNGYAQGGIIGGNSFNGDNLVARVNSGEMVLTRNQQSSLFGFIDSLEARPLKNNAFGNAITNILTNSNDVRTKPIGEKEYIYIPNGSTTSNVNGNNVTVNDINVKINGTIRLDGGNSSKNIDVSQLLNDSQFISQLKDIIKMSINNDINGGRFMNDMAQMRGMPAQTSLWGRK